MGWPPRASSARWRQRRAIILITVHNKLNYLLDAERIGASAYLFKDASRKEIVAAVSRVIAGETLLTAEGAERCSRHTAGSGSDWPTNVHRLTARENEVLQLVAEGKTNKGIAMLLHISPGTAKVHVERILGKLGAADRTEAVVRALQLGLISGRDS